MILSEEEPNKEERDKSGARVRKKLSDEYGWEPKASYSTKPSYLGSFMAYCLFTCIVPIVVMIIIIMIFVFP